MAFKSKFLSSQIEDEGLLHRLVAEMMSVLTPGLPTPVIKVNNSQGRTLGVCRWKYGLKDGQPYCADNTEIEIQKRVMKDERTLRRILFHEGCHHEDLLINERADFEKYGYHTYQMFQRKRRDGGHGSNWMAIAKRFNAKYGAAFVTVTSDQDNVIDNTNLRPFYILIQQSYDGKLGWQIASMLSPKMKEYLAYCANGEASYPTKLFMSADPELYKGAPMKKFYGHSYPRNDHAKAELQRLWDSGEDILSRFKSVEPKQASVEVNPDDNNVMKQIEEEFRGLREAEGEGQCYTMAEILNHRFGWESAAGFYLEPGRGHNGHGDHAWNVTKNGTIVDATHDQFGPPDIAVLTPADPEYAKYHAFCGDQSCPYCGCDHCNPGFAKEGSHKTPALSDTTFPNMDKRDGEGTNAYALLPDEVEGAGVTPKIETMMGGKPEDPPQHPPASLKRAAYYTPTLEGVVNMEGAAALSEMVDWGEVEPIVKQQHPNWDDLPENEQDELLKPIIMPMLQSRFEDILAQFNKPRLTVYRAIDLPGGLKDVQKDFARWGHQAPGFGACWSWAESGAKSYCSSHGLGEDYVFRGVVQHGDVNWDDSFLFNVSNDEEKEIRLFKGVEVQLDAYRYKDGPWTPVAPEFRTVTAASKKSYGVVMVEMPRGITDAFEIDEEDLAGDGREDEAHVTVKYGLIG